MNLVDLLVYLFLCGVGMYVLWWGLGRIGLGEPWNKVATAALVVITVVLILRPLLGYTALPHFGL